jgi:hypothetical protein
MILVERSYRKDCTWGVLSIAGFKCFTLELPWKDNAKDISCIPEGTYEYDIKKSIRTGSDVIWLNYVEDRNAIQVHPGNYTKQILGCILVGDSIKFVDTDSIPDVTNSKTTFDNLLSILPKKGQIKIVQATA